MSLIHCVCRTNSRSPTRTLITRPLILRTVSSLSVPLLHRRVSDLCDHRFTREPWLLQLRPLASYMVIGGNPAFKVYDVDPDTFEVMDMKVYMSMYHFTVSLPASSVDYIPVSCTDAMTEQPTSQTRPSKQTAVSMTAAHPIFSTSLRPTTSHIHVPPRIATWELYYSARDSYGPLVSAFTDTPLSPTDPLNASFWHTLTEVFEANATAFQEWNTRLSRGGNVVACTGDCMTTSICDMRAARSENDCVSLH